MHATNNKYYTQVEHDVAIEEARKGRIVTISTDGKRATVEVKYGGNIGGIVVYCGVHLDKEGKVTEFITKKSEK